MVAVTARTLRVCGGIINMRIDIWSDLVCPWCYVGKRRFERALAAFARPDEVEVVHRAYLLYASSARGMTFDRRDMLMTKYRMTQDQADALNVRMERTAAAEGLDYHLKGGVTGNTFDAHQVVYLGRDRGRQDAVLERLYHAFFVEQRSIFAHESLVALGAEAGLDAEDVARVLRDNAYATAVEADLEEALAIQVKGVPFFVFDGRYAVAGAQQADVFTQALAGVPASIS
jgi:predicted DsbA family dithiol-disulfide isomerase